jgi:thioredoxin-related protein
MKKLLLIAIIAIYLPGTVFSQHPANTGSSGTFPKWYGMEEGMKLAKKKKKAVIVDIYTDWCGWCTKMDRETFADPAVVSYLNDKFIAIKLNAEGKEPVSFNGKTYTNPSPESKRSTHGLAVQLTRGQLSYPTYVYLDSNGGTITITKGYMQAEDMLPLLQYIGSDAYKTKSWKEFTGLN